MIIIGGSKESRRQIRELWDRSRDILDSSIRTQGKEAELTSQIVSLKTELSDLQIQKAKKEEEFARREREIDHKVGLVKKSQELELESQKLELREASLTQKEEAFKKEMKFMTDRMEKENVYVREMLESMMKRLPSAELMMNITQTKKAR